MSSGPLGPEPTCPPPDPNPTKPAHALPPLACDSHFHIFGPAARFPWAPIRTFTPHDAPKVRLFALHKLLGFERGVFVQASCHGPDHGAVRLKISQDGLSESETHPRARTADGFRPPISGLPAIGMIDAQVG